MKFAFPVLVALSAVCALAQASEPRTVIPSAELAELRARVTALESVIVRTGDNEENVELRAPSLHGSIALVTGNGDKVVEVAYPVTMPNCVPSLGFFGHAPVPQEGVYGDWNLGQPDEWNQSFMFGTLIDSIGTNTGNGLVKDMRANF